jgi:hypothetical protein
MIPRDPTTWIEAPLETGEIVRACYIGALDRKLILVQYQPVDSTRWIDASLWLSAPEARVMFTPPDEWQPTHFHERFSAMQETYDILDLCQVFEPLFFHQVEKPHEPSV